MELTMSKRDGNKARQETRAVKRKILLSDKTLSSDDKVRVLLSELDSLKGELRDARSESLTTSYAKTKIFELSEGKLISPSWMISKRNSSSKTLGIPTIFASDWHYGEKVFASQIEGINSFDLAIADLRIQALVNNSLDILFNHLSNPKYDGLVFPLGGDMFSGNIHEELANTNEDEMLPCVIRLTGRLYWAIKVFADHFGKVHVPVVTGNHGRTTRKPIHKNRVYSNYDWLLGCMLAREFKDDPRVTFQISDGTDCQYSIYNHRYSLTHGDQFSGGGDIAGAIVPVLRGDAKKRNREGQINKTYDTLICGHFHQLVVTKKAIINGSLKGYDEYAYAHNFPYEPPQQAMWLTHPEHGITFCMPIFLDEKKKDVKYKLPITF
tara:strand:- start:1642 stop:2784 length:1143 start_codon:yes stop_codon:yes gene_type:complete